jgi:hypothetical protein
MYVCKFVCMYEQYLCMYVCMYVCMSRKTDLLTEYKDRIKKQVASWFENIKKQPLEIIKVLHPIIECVCIYVCMYVCVDK